MDRFSVGARVVVLETGMSGRVTETDAAAGYYVHLANNYRRWFRPDELGLSQDQGEPVDLFGPPPDMVNEPPHYAELDPQPLDVIESWGLDHHRACALKYIARAGRKNDFGEDVRKAITYLQRLVKMLEAR
jgi:hypothetical protein